MTSAEVRSNKNQTYPTLIESFIR